MSREHLEIPESEEVLKKGWGLLSKGQKAKAGITGANRINNDRTGL